MNDIHFYEGIHLPYFANITKLVKVGVFTIVQRVPTIMTGPLVHYNGIANDKLTILWCLVLTIQSLVKGS